MRYLIDTHTLLWWLDGSPQLGEAARQAMERSESGLYFSLASIWELSIKVALGKLVLAADLSHVVGVELQRNAILKLPIEVDHCLTLQALPPHHKDPFDRMLVSQAVCEGLQLISKDAVFDRYSVRRIW